jgi:pentatricopeptide repeat protein
VFDQLPVQDITSWNALIAAYVQVGSDEEALNQFWKMHSVGTGPDVGTYLCVLKACGNTGCVSSGEYIYCNLVRYAFMLKDSLSGTALVDMYVKCGLLTKAHEVFNQVMVRDVIIWSALITGYAQFGEDEIVVNMFNQMIQEGLQPDAATFTVVLNACSHSGLLEKAELVFKALVGEYGIIPTLTHHACMVDLFCRAGDFDKAVVILQNMPTSDYFPAWISLLSGCNKCRNVKLGEAVFDHVLQLNESHPSAYVCMGNIYAVAGE